MLNAAGQACRLARSFSCGRCMGLAALQWHQNQAAAQSTMDQLPAADADAAAGADAAADADPAADVWSEEQDDQSADYDGA